MSKIRRSTPPAPAQRPPIPCANAACNNMVDRSREYSFIVVLATHGPHAIGSFQCPDVSEIEAGNFDAQHFCCSIECAAIAAHACIDEDLVPRHHQEVAKLTGKAQPNG